MEALESIGRIISDAASSPSAKKFSEAGTDLVRARDAVREDLQKLTAEAMTPIIEKLEQNQPLSFEEKDLIRLWIVGDAEGFTKRENDFQVWLEEFRRLGEIIRDKGRIPNSYPEFLDLYGDLEEAVRLAGDIQFFLEEKERVARFEQAIQNLSGSEGEILAGILKAKLNSPEM